MLLKFVEDIQREGGGVRIAVIFDAARKKNLLGNDIYQNIKQMNQTRR